MKKAKKDAIIARHVKVIYIIICIIFNSAFK